MGQEPNIPGTDEQYRSPTQSAGPTGYAWWAAGPVLGQTGGERYVDEGDPSWEDVITMVVIPGDPGRIRAGAGAWEVLFRRIEQAKRLLDDGIRDLESWKGEAGQAYREHLSKVSQTFGELVSKHQGVTTSMTIAADNLEAAINKIPIPEDMVYEVQAAKGSINTDKVAGTWFRSGYIYDKLLPIMGNRWADEIGELFQWEWAQKNLRDWISTNDDEAKQAFRTLASSHVSTMDGMPGDAEVRFVEPQPPYVPSLQPVNAPGVGGFSPGTGVPGGMPPGSVPSGTVPGTGDIPGGGVPPGVVPGSDVPPGDVPGSGDLPNSTGYPDAGSVPETELAGADGGGLVGSGPGSSGLGGGGLGSAPGTGGLGSGVGPGGGRGGGMPPVGGLGGVLPGAGGGTGRSGVGRPAGGSGGRPGLAGVPAAGMAGGGPGAGARGGGRGTGALGMIPPGAAGHGAGEGEDHSTWLNEEDDVWGGDSDAPPAVLGN